jgi:hypothetical protein
VAQQDARAVVDDVVALAVEVPVSPFVVDREAGYPASAAPVKRVDTGRSMEEEKKGGSGEWSGMVRK